jgi:hypothetical protein
MVLLLRRRFSSAKAKPADNQFGHQELIGPERGPRTMANDHTKAGNSQDHYEACYEELASQEEIYLEEREERARAVLIAESLSSSGLSSESAPLEARDSVPGANNNPASSRNVKEQLDQAAEELITGDSDDPPLCEETVTKMLKPD